MNPCIHGFRWDAGHLVVVAWAGVKGRQTRITPLRRRFRHFVVKGPAFGPTSQARGRTKSRCDISLAAVSKNMVPRVDLAIIGVKSS